MLSLNIQTIKVLHEKRSWRQQNGHWFDTAGFRIKVQACEAMAPCGLLHWRSAVLFFSGGLDNNLQYGRTFAGPFLPPWSSGCPAESPWPGSMILVTRCFRTRARVWHAWLHWNPVRLHELMVALATRAESQSFSLSNIKKGPSLKKQLKFRISKNRESPSPTLLTRLKMQLAASLHIRPVGPVKNH